MRRARAKVNLWLNVIGRRAGGHHLLHSLVAFCDLADVLEVEPAEELSLRIDGPASHELRGEQDNLVLRAARLLAARAGIAPRAAFRLTKRIPVAAGLGGGSADAAAALRALSELWRLDLPAAELFALATALGADVPVCLGGRAAIASGIGERLEPAPALPACGVLLVNPGRPLATGDVFAARRGAFSSPRPVAAPWRDVAEFVAALGERGNDLTEAAIALEPAIGEVLAHLRRHAGVRYAAMSGSGATCFAVCETTAAAEHVASDLPAAWWRHAGHLVDVEPHPRIK